MQPAHARLSSSFRVAVRFIVVLGLIFAASQHDLSPAVSSAALELPPDPAIVYGDGAPATQTAPSDTLTETIDLPPPVSKQIAARDGGTIAASDGRLSIDFPAESLPKDATVTVRPLGSDYPSLSGGVVVQAYRVELKGTTDNQDIHTLAKAVTITLTHQPGDYIAVVPGTIRLIAFDESSGTWEYLPTTIADDKLTVTATTTHFSDIVEEGDPNVAGPAQVMSFENDLYSGAAVASIPLELPAGPGGFAPRLTLTYSSAAVDNMHSETAMGSWVGIGWSLGLGAITKNTQTQRLTLSIAGVSEKLVPETLTTYHTERESFLKITHNFVNQEWTVVDKNGTTYLFGSTRYFYDGEGLPVIYQWDLTKITDTHGNTIDIS